MPYPHTTGWKDQEISRENARQLDESGRAGTLRGHVASLFMTGFVGTADEAAVALKEDILAVRPRCSELRRLGWIERVPGERRKAQGGGLAAVLRLSQEAITSLEK